LPYSLSFPLVRRTLSLGVEGFFGVVAALFGVEDVSRGVRQLEVSLRAYLAAEPRGAEV
jgi:hypothetical protein